MVTQIHHGSWYVMVLWRLGWCRLRGRWPARDGWLGLGLVLLSVAAGPAQDVVAQVNIRQVDAQVNLPYAVQFGFGSYDVGGLSVNVFRIPVKHTVALEPKEAAWRRRWFPKPITLWIFEIEKPRLGVSYRFGDGLSGVRVQFGFPF